MHAAANFLSSLASRLRHKHNNISHKVCTANFEQTQLNPCTTLGKFSNKYQTTKKQKPQYSVIFNLTLLY